ncbi:hypothetical protein [Embleya hyalina]|nr:hypothetical protein [Embleya hyalina]
MTPSRVADYVEGRVCAQRHTVLERVADGLRIPGAMLGLAPRDWESARSRVSSQAGEYGTGEGSLPDPRLTRGLNPRSRTVRLGLFTQAVIETSRAVDIDIDTRGRAVVRVRENVHNLGAHPVTRLHHDFWFERTVGRFDVRLSHGVGSGDGQRLERLHDTSTLSKFVVCLPEPLTPGDTARIEYVCTGGVFDDRLFWRQTIARPTEQLWLRVRHRGPQRIDACTAVQEHHDGGETPVGTRVDRAPGVTELNVIRSHLMPGEALVLRWHRDEPPAR